MRLSWAFEGGSVERVPVTSLSAQVGDDAPMAQVQDGKLEAKIVRKVPIKSLTASVGLIVEVNNG